MKMRLGSYTMLRLGVMVVKMPMIIIGTDYDNDGKEES